MQLIIYLGNHKAVEVARGAGEDTEVRTAVPGKQCTTVVPPAGTTLAEAFRAVTDPQGVWTYHADSPPAWVAVAGDDPAVAEALATLLATNYGCPVREPDPGPTAPRLGPAQEARVR